MQALKRTEKASHGQESLVSGSQKHVVGASSDSQTIETSSSSSETKEKHKISFLSRFSGCGVLLQQNKAIQQTPESQISTPGSLSSNELYTEQPEMPLGSLGKSERVDCSDIANRSSSARQSVKENWQWEQQRDFWKKAVLKRSVRYGPKHLLTADGLMNLGNSHLSCDVSNLSQYSKSAIFLAYSTGSSHLRRLGVSRSRKVISVSSEGLSSYLWGLSS
jgi:hypothetical protein